MEITFKKTALEAIDPDLGSDGILGEFYNLYTPKNFKLATNGSITIDLGISIKLPKSYYAFTFGNIELLSTRLINVPLNVVTSNGLANLKIVATNTGSTPAEIRKGECVAQLIFLKVPHIKLVPQEKLSEVELDKDDKLQDNQSE